MSNSNPHIYVIIRFLYKFENFRKYLSTFNFDIYVFMPLLLKLFYMYHESKFYMYHKSI